MSAPKSGLLDQILLEDIARHCPQEFLAFHRCMSQPEPDPQECGKEQMALAGCIKFQVPAFQKVQKICAGRLQAYEACLKATSNSRGKCNNELQALRDCAFKTLDR